MTDEEFFYTRYKETAHAVADEITRYHDLFLPTFPSDDPFRVETFRFIRDGGKRFRPSLSHIIARSYGFDYLFPHLALEIFHKYLLTHDDIIDRDQVRYATQTVHTKMEELFDGISMDVSSHKGLHDSVRTHFGNSLGMIAGDVMEANTYKIIFMSDLDDSTKVVLGGLVARAVEEVAWGWYDQFLMDYLPLSSPGLSYERIERSIIWVTGKYSLSFPVRFAYALVGQSMPDGFEHLCEDLGVLFQTGDDLIGLFGDFHLTQKSNFGDIVQGKKTIPLWYAYILASDSGKRLLETLVGKKDISEGEVEQVRDVIRTSGAVDKTRQLMREYCDACLGQIDALVVPNDLKKFLRGFALYLEKREF